MGDSSSAPAVVTGTAAFEQEPTRDSTTPYKEFDQATTADPHAAAYPFEKEQKFTDVAFAIIFVLHLIVMAVVLMLYQPDGNDADSDWTFDGVWGFTWITTVTAIGLCTIAFLLMNVLANVLVQVALIASVIATLIVAIQACIDGTAWLAVIGFICFFLSVCYVKFVWHKIPFASSNLRTAIAALQANMGLIFMAYMFAAVGFGWTLFWMNATGAAMSTIGWPIVFLYLVSFFWTQQVLSNIVKVVVASVIGTWWCRNGGDATQESKCDSGLSGALIQATTYNLGSIAFGSLVTSVLQALQWLQRQARNQASNCCCRSILCMVEILLSCVTSIVEYFNHWAYTFIGLHGTDYVTSGKQVMGLFQARGWSAIITDTLADGVMRLLILAITLLTGLTGWALTRQEQTYYESQQQTFEGIGVAQENEDVPGFFMAALIGFLLSSILMNVVSATVNAVIVCFAEAPREFAANHSELSQDMLRAWVQAYPEEGGDEFAQNGNFDVENQPQKPN